MQKTLTQAPLSSTEKALMAYLDDMLRDGTRQAREAEVVVPAGVVAPVVASPVVVPAAPVAEPVPVVVAKPAPVVEKPVATPVVEPVRKPVTREVAVPVEPAVVVATPTPAVIVQAPAIITRSPRDEVDASVDAVPSLPGIPDWLDRGRPEWANAPFEALMFKVGGLKMAVPLVSLGLIHPIQKRFNELPGQNPWFLGMLRTPNATIKVIDTALCVMPERYDPASRDSLKYVITLHGYEWGLAANEVDKAIALDPSKIQWRTKRGKRPWLAGTVVDHMCALIDSEGFHQVIAAAEGSHGDPLA